MCRCQLSKLAAGKNGYTGNQQRKIQLPSYFTVDIGASFIIVDSKFPPLKIEEFDIQITFNFFCTYLELLDPSYSVYNFIANTLSFPI